LRNQRSGQAFAALAQKLGIHYNVNEMAESEIAVFVTCLIIAAIGWGLWLRDVFSSAILTRKANHGRIVLLSVILGLAGLYLILRKWSASDVRNSFAYVAFYEVMGAAWLAVVARILAWMGIGLRDDVVERRNFSAALALSGAILGVSICFAGGNIGDGPGWWVVLYCAGLATSGLLLIWLATEFGARVSEAVTVDRDGAAGLRLGALLLASGLILGRSVAGDWQSADSTLRDFVFLAYPVFLLPIAETVITRSSQSSSLQQKNAFSLEGILPAVAYLGLAILYIRSLGLWK
jgi:uncharacterized membrane protein YjfL (UPF0719 family)